MHSLKGERKKFMPQKIALTTHPSLIGQNVALKCFSTSSVQQANKTHKQTRKQYYEAAF